MFRLAYDFSKQGVIEHEAPFLAHPGERFFGVFGDPYQGSDGDFDFLATRAEIDVVHNGSYIIFTASCDN